MRQGEGKRITMQTGTQEQELLANKGANQANYVLRFFFSMRAVGLVYRCSGTRGRCRERTRRMTLPAALACR